MDLEVTPRMLPAGYMYKRVERGIYSVSGCISKNFTDYIKHWRHNALWFFDAPAVLDEVAAAEGSGTKGLTLFYYEISPEQYEGASWSAFDASAPGVVVPAVKQLEGFDVVTFFGQSAPECSPLSCNGLGEGTTVNSHSLFGSFESAKQALDSGFFEYSEPGPYRIFAVYSL
jgi:hypothetical protein